MTLPKSQEELDALIANSVDKAVTGLKNKNSELLGVISENKKTMAKFDGVDIEGLTSAANELKELKKKGDEEKGEYKKLYEQAQESHTKELGKLQKVNDKQTKTITDMTKKTTIAAALQAAKVLPELMEVATTTLMDTVAIDDAGNVMVGDKTAMEHITGDWAKSDVGKHFIANGNSGGGANGGGGDGAGEEAGWFKKDSPTYSLTKQAQLAKSNPELASKLRKQNSVTQ